MEDQKIEEQIDKLDSYWENKPGLTQEQLKAIDEFAKRKSVSFDGILHSKIE